MLIYLGPLRVKRKIFFRWSAVRLETFAAFERLTREIEIRDEGETEKIEKQALAANKIGPRCVSGLKLHGIGRG
jgi:hypothetical protein